MRRATAYAHTNIALVKYWGKRDVALNLPATGSLSLTLDRFGTETTVAPHDAETDRLVLDGEEVAGKERERVSRFLDIVRTRAGKTARCLVTSRNDVPTAAGLASSASAFAALATAACAAFGIDADARERSILARRGSGSAARSIHGGFVVMHKGMRDDGEDCFAEPASTSKDLDVRLVVARCASGRKKTGSTDGMTLTEQTSPYYPVWVATHDDDLRAAERALAAGDLAALGRTMERSTLKMHASAFAADPGLWYLMPVTIAVMNAVRALHDEGVQAYFTMDAGPHVKILCPTKESASIAERIAAIDGVLGVEIAGPGRPASVRLDV
jgi:diphosphomevalonate decarboxylase